MVILMPKKPSFTEAYEAKWKADRIMLSYTWPFFAVLLGGMLLVYTSFPEISEKRFLISLGLFVIFGVIVNIFYYRMQRK